VNEHSESLAVLVTPFDVGTIARALRNWRSPTESFEIRLAARQDVIGGVDALGPAGQFHRLTRGLVEFGRGAGEGGADYPDSGTRRRGGGICGRFPGAGRFQRDEHDADENQRRTRELNPVHRFAEDQRAKADREYRAERADER